jgi:cell division protein YceG involved in septum cleavage
MAGWYHAEAVKKTNRFRLSVLFYLLIGLAVAVAGAALIPIFVLSRHTPEISSSAPLPFPVTVDPARKSITENAEVEALLSRGNLSLTSAAINAGDFFYDAAAAIASAPVYQFIAAGLGPRIVRVEPGYRREEIADVLGGALRWDKSAKDAFLKTIKAGPDLVEEGRIFPGLYAVESGMSTTDLASAFRDRFERKILSRYSTTTEAVVPLSQTLTIASMIERETSDKDEMRHFRHHLEPDIRRHEAPA